MVPMVVVHCEKRESEDLVTISRCSISEQMLYSSPLKSQIPGFHLNFPTFLKLLRPYSEV